jgi:carotenoid cleavage dioxygenase-like enzyme
MKYYPLHRLIEFEKGSYSRIGVMPRYGDAESVMWFDLEPLCMFHLINCFEEGDEVHSILLSFPTFKLFQMQNITMQISSFPGDLGCCPGLPFS